MKGQRGAVLEYLRKHKKITSIEAFEKFGATRLSAIIFNFRKMGMNIQTKSVVTKNRYGETTVYAEYILIDEEEC